MVSASSRFLRLLTGEDQVLKVTVPRVFQACGETSRFEKLMEYFCREEGNIDFVVNSSSPAHL